MHYALDVAQAAVLGHSLLLRDGARHGEALLDALLREGGRGAHEHDGRLVCQHLRVQLGEELVLLEGPRRLHLAAGEKEEEDSRLAAQCGWNEIVLVRVHTDSFRLQVGERPRDILEGVKSGGDQLGVIAILSLQRWTPCPGLQTRQNGHPAWQTRSSPRSRFRRRAPLECDTAC